MPHRTPIVGGNWKMHLDLPGAETLSRALRGRLGSWRAAQVVVFPAMPLIAPVRRVLRDSAIEVGGQDLHAEDAGAFTGASSGPMLRSLGCTRVLIGHSERRHVFGDTDAAVAAKLRAALRAGLDPVLCVGETLDDRRAGRTHEVLARQIEVALRGCDGARLVIAYEPVWAIGTGQTATPAQAQEAHAFVRERVAAVLGAATAAAVPIQYGGSVKPGNADGLAAMPDVDGALVGGASLDAASFFRIAAAFARNH